MAPTVWYHVRNLDEGRRFYRAVLGFEELSIDLEARWSELRRGEMEIGLAEGEPTEDGVAYVDVANLKEEADRLREAGVEVGIVLELTGEIRLLDVYDTDGNRIQLAQELARVVLRPADQRRTHFLHAMLRRLSPGGSAIPTCPSIATCRTGAGAVTRAWSPPTARTRTGRRGTASSRPRPPVSVSWTRRRRR